MLCLGDIMCKCGRCKDRYRIVKQFSSETTGVGNMMNQNQGANIMIQIQRKRLLARRSAMTFVMYFVVSALLPVASGQIIPPVDVALGKLVEAEITCNEETFYPASQENLSPADRQVQVCADILSFPPSNMVDGDPLTWWQSTSRNSLTAQGFGRGSNPEIVIDIDLAEVSATK